MTNLFKFYKKHTETEDELIIRWADTLIYQSNYKGDIDTASFLPFDEMFLSAPPTNEDKNQWSMDKARRIRNHIRTIIIGKHGNNDINLISNEISKYRAAVLKHLLNEGYILEPSIIDTTWKLTERGKIVKELNGHRKYKKHRQRELHILRNQNKINTWLISATILAAVMPLVVAKLFQTTNIISVQPSRTDTDKLHQPFSGETTKKAPIQDTTKKPEQPQTMSQAP